MDRGKSVPAMWNSLISPGKVARHYHQRVAGGADPEREKSWSRGPFTTEYGEASKNSRCVNCWRWWTRAGEPTFRARESDSFHGSHGDGPDCLSTPTAGLFVLLDEVGENFPSEQAKALRVIRIANSGAWVRRKFGTSMYA